MRWFSKIRAYLRGGRERFGAAIAWCALLALYASYTDLAGSDAVRLLGLGGRDRIFGALLLSAGFAAVWQVFCERRGIAGVLRHLASLPAAALFYGWLAFAPYGEFLRMETAGIAAALLAMGLYFLARDGAGGVFSRVLTAALKAAGLSVLLAVSLSVCFWAADALLFDLGYEWYFVVWHVSVLFVGGALGLSFLPRGDEEEAPRWVRIVLLRLLLPVYLVLLLILYGYLGKICVIGELPSGEMNWFASLASFGYAFFWFCLRGGEEKFLKRFFRWMPAVLLPLVCVQLCCVFVRLTAYGLTPLRHLSLAATAFGLLIMAAGAAGRGGRKLYPIAALLALLLTVTPANLLDTARRDQEYRAQTVMETYGMLQGGEIISGEPLPQDARDRLFGAYEYLRDEYPAYRDTEGRLPLSGRVVLDEMKPEAMPEKEAFARQVASSPVLAALWEAAEKEKNDEAGRFREIVRQGPADIAGYDRLYEIDCEVKDGMLKVKTDEGDMSYAVGARLAEIFAAEAPDAFMVFAPDERHRIILNRCTRWRENEYGVEGYLLEK